MLLMITTCVCNSAWYVILAPFLTVPVGLVKWSCNILTYCQPVKKDTSLLTSHFCSVPSLTYVIYPHGLFSQLCLVCYIAIISYCARLFTQLVISSSTISSTNKLKYHFLKFSLLVDEMVLDEMTS